MSNISPSAQHIPPPTDSKSSKKKKKKKGAAKDKEKSNEHINSSQTLTKEQVDTTKDEQRSSPSNQNDKDTQQETSPSETQSSHPSRPPEAEPNTLTNGTSENGNAAHGQSSQSRLDALVEERDALRLEVRQVRQSLEELQAEHQTVKDAAQEDLQAAKTGKEHAEEQYQNLLDKVTTIKAQLGDKLKADAAELAQARSHIEALEEENASLQHREATQSSQIESLTADFQAQSKELSSLRNRSNLSEQQWLKEREELIEQETYTREQYDNSEQAMREWEVLAMEERSIRKDLDSRKGELEEQLAGLQVSNERATRERDSLSTTVDGLQKALQEIQAARKLELRELVESSQAEKEKLQAQLAEAQNNSAAAKTELENVKKELERALPFEKEAKEKNLLIGKLRHEAVTLNEHLTKALRFLKRGKPEDTVDRQIVTNHLLHFLSLDRSDPKKFQILQLIAALLAWTDEQRQQAGLSRPGSTANLGSTSNTPLTGASNSPLISPSSGSGGGFGSLRLQNYSFSQRSRPSTPALAADQFQDPDHVSPGKESLAELWQGFLEQESGDKTAPTPAPAPAPATGPPSISEASEQSNP